MDEDEPTRQRVGETAEASTKKKPAKRRGAPAASQKLMMNGGAIFGAGNVGQGAVVNITNNHHSETRIIVRNPEAAPAPQPQELMAAWLEASLQRYEARRFPFEDQTYRLTPFPNGHYLCAYRLSGDLQKQDLADFYDLRVDARIWHTDHPPFWVYDSDPFTRIQISQEAIDGAMESWSGSDLTRATEDPSFAEFWRVSPAGEAFMIRGLNEDRLSEASRSFLHLEQAMQRVAAPLLHAANLARALGDDQARIAFVMKWEGLKGRRLLRYFTHMGDGRLSDPCHQDVIRLSLECGASEVETRLPELILELLKPLVALFGFSRLTLDEVQREIEAMFEASRRARGG